MARREDKLNELKATLENKHGVTVMVIVKDLTLPNAAAEIYEEIKQAGLVSRLASALPYLRHPCCRRRCF